MNRITNSDLKHLVDRLNRITASPLEPYSQIVLPDNTTKFTSNIGNYHVDSAYGGVKLVHLCNASGGIRDMLSTGYTTKRALFNAIQCYIAGIECAKDAKAHSID